MTGFFNGVSYYNTQKGTTVEVLGWDPLTKTGLFTGNFESLDDGRRIAETLMDEGADVIYPVAGPCGLGSAAAIQERGTAMMIGTDTDMVISSPEYTGILLTTVLKNMDVAVFDAAKMVQDGKFAGGLYVGTMTNGGVGLASYHDFESKVPADLKAEVERVGKDIADGKLDPWVLISFTTLPTPTETINKFYDLTYDPKKWEVDGSYLVYRDDPNSCKLILFTKTPSETHPIIQSTIDISGITWTITNYWHLDWIELEKYTPMLKEVEKYNSYAIVQPWIDKNNNFHVDLPISSECRQLVREELLSTFQPQ